MPKDEKIRIAVSYDNKGNVVSVAKIKVVSKDELNRFINEQAKNEALKQQHLNALERKISKLTLDMLLIKGEIDDETYNNEVKKYELV